MTQECLFNFTTTVISMIDGSEYRADFAACVFPGPYTINENILKSTFQTGISFEVVLIFNQNFNVVFK